MLKRKWTNLRQPCKLFLSCFMLLWMSYVIYTFDGDFAALVWSNKIKFRAGDHIPHSVTRADKRTWITEARRKTAKQPIRVINHPPTDIESWKIDENMHIIKQPITTNSLVPNNKKMLTDARHEAHQPLISKNLIAASQKMRVTDTDRHMANKPTRIPKTFEFIIDIPTVCSLQNWNTSIEVLIFITSSYEHVIKRQSLRKSWLLNSRNNTSNVRYIFILGISENKTLIQNIIKEHAYHKDIVVANFLDTYKNLTLKTIAGFHWALRHCAHARFVMKTDDDIYVNIPGLVNILQREDENFTLGQIWRNATPNRNASHKWFVPVDQYPNTTYPDYFDGLGYILSMKHVYELLNTYPSVNFLSLEDIYVGMCLKQMGISLENKDFHVFVRKHLAFPPCFYKHENVIAAHGVPETLMETIFKEPCQERGDLSKAQWHELNAYLTRYEEMFTTKDYARNPEEDERP